VQETSAQTFEEVERNELEAVIVHLERTPRLAKLLHYLAQKYFDGETNDLTEYNIATEVFGRKKTDFVASEDAIARVETHRLRKKLKLFYENEGKDHCIQLLIPPGTYVPVFIEQGTKTNSSAEPIAFGEKLYSKEKDDLLTQSGEPVPEAGATGQRLPPPIAYPTLPLNPWRHIWLYALITAVAVVFGLAIYKTIHARRRASTQNQVGGPAVTENGEISHRANEEGSQPPSVTLPFRLIAGYTGPPQKDSAGDVWLADQYYHEGWAQRQPAVFVARTSDPILFRTARAGDFSYDIPLKPGTYELHLYFFEPSETAQSEDAENKSVFNVSINGKTALPEFDIVSDAMGRNIADERVLRDVSPAPDGMLHLTLNTVFGMPSLSAIQLLQGTPGRQLPVRVVTQPTPFTDHEGHEWHPDNYFLGGRHLSHNLPVNGSSDPDLLPAERYGHFTYAFPVDPRDRYTVVLHFVELFFGTDEAGASGKGNRIFRVLCNGNTLLDDFDIYKEVGDYHMLTKTFHHLKPTAQGKLNLTFEPVSNYATVSAIEVIDESN
jgi:hypothetical protein